MLLQPYMGQVTFVHKAGKRHLNVDALFEARAEDRRQGGNGGAGSEEEDRAAKGKVRRRGGNRE
jgi:hypothetical protein